MAPEEAEAVASLLQQILQYDPAKRPTATDLLRHPWIEKFCAGKAPIPCLDKMICTKYVVRKNLLVLPHKHIFKLAGFFNLISVG